ncbi:TIM barrel protein [Enterococcus sp.]|uniref:sugar phosphate isomerase/epimerase family protein n=1 Tax=Enterococcus sp. TaxID=35783 RepID=UPI0025BE972B|nr:TIM barrel protein [Enterococcus sp.]
MNNFTITGFADEISPNVSKQIRVLKQNDIRHIEVRGLDGKNISELTLSEAREYKQQFEKAGIVVSSIGSPIGKIKLTDDFAEHLALFKHVLELAVIFESPYVRMFSFYIDDLAKADDYQNEVLERWQQFLEIAKEYPQITLLHENEKDIYGDTPERCLHLLQALNSPQVKAAFDPANFVQCDVEVFPHAYHLLKKHIAYMHIKDARYEDHRVTPAGKGDGQVQNVLEALVADGFSGFASLEPHLSIFDGFADLESGDSIASNEGNGAKLFTVASEALKTILVSEMEQEWK